MAPKMPILMVAGVSAAVGLALLITSSLVVDLFRPAVEVCNKAPFKPKDCTYFDYWIAAGSFGITAGLIQIGSFGLAFLGKIKPWCGLHVMICILSIVSFALAVGNYGFSEGVYKKMTAHTVFSLIDMLFSAAAAVGVHFLDRS